jgi:two-component system OmpR family sensor kinase
MSIRLRLTLLYSTILTLTLLSFGALLYANQAQASLAIEKQNLSAAAHRLADSRRAPPDRSLPESPPDLTERYFQRRSADGQQVLETDTPSGLVLPLSNDAFQAAQGDETWMEIASVGGQRILIYTVPIVANGQLSEILQMGRSLSTRDQILRALGTGLLVGAIVAILAAFALGWVLAGAALRPIHRLTQTAQAVGAGRDFSRRVEHPGPDDEVGRLAKTFNAMLAELQAAYQQVEEALEKQRRFVADVSHELRTPLTTINGNVELLRREPPISDEDRTEVLSDMAGESKRLIRLVRDLLVLARADARRPSQGEPVWIEPLVQDVCRQARLLGAGRTIVCESPLDVAVCGQADSLKQVLLILLDNAIKHGDGVITVVTRVADGRVVTSVSDAGPGVDPELLPHLFERFARGRSDGADSGIGLGLAIAKALVEAQGGTITVESLPGQGTTFSVTLSQAAVPCQLQ